MGWLEREPELAEHVLTVEVDWDLGAVTVFGLSAAPLATLSTDELRSAIWAHIRAAGLRVESEYDVCSDEYEERLRELLETGTLRAEGACENQFLSRSRSQRRSRLMRVRSRASTYSRRSYARLRHRSM